MATRFPAKNRFESQALSTWTFMAAYLSKSIVRVAVGGLLVASCAYIMGGSNAKQLTRPQILESIRDITLKKITKPIGSESKASSLWKDNGAVIMVVRRMG
mmetsp:Transcript_25823/g.45855  ORF Transcript_25823/g.45855 Transcript_25823/m.45855 type:complete len:101 (+) Transcript_25823:1-303(+)